MTALGAQQTLSLDVPDGWTNLRLVVQGRSTAMQPVSNWGLILNDDQTFGKYLWQELSGSGTILTALATTSSYAVMGLMPAGTSQAVLPGIFDVRLNNYSDHGYYPTMISQGGLAWGSISGQMASQLFAAVYLRSQDLSVITPWVTKVTIFLESGWWVNGTIMQLIGDDLPIAPAAPQQPIVAYAPPIKVTSEGFLVLPRVRLTVRGGVILTCPIDDELIWLTEEESSGTVHEVAQWYCVEQIDVQSSSQSSSSKSVSSVSSMSSESVSASSSSLTLSSQSASSSSPSSASVSSLSSQSSPSSSSLSLSSVSSASSASSASSLSSQSVSSQSASSASSLSSLSSASSASSPSSQSSSSASSQSSSSSSSQGYFALSFASASSQYVELTNNAAFQLTTAMSLSAWVRMTSVGGVILGRYSDFSGAGGFMIDCPAGPKLRFLLSNNGESVNGTATSSTLSTGVLYHVVGTWDGSSAMKLYINGSVDGTGTFAATPGNIVGASLLAGAYYGPAGTVTNFFNGKIDACRIYNKALNSTEVSQIYGSGLGLATAGTATANLQGWWKYDEGSGTTANDSSGNSRNGTIHGATYTAAGTKG